MILLGGKCAAGCKLIGAGGDGFYGSGYYDVREPAVKGGG